MLKPRAAAGLFADMYGALRGRARNETGRLDEKKRISFLSNIENTNNVCL